MTPVIIREVWIPLSPTQMVVEGDLNATAKRYLGVAVMLLPARIDGHNSICVRWPSLDPTRDEEFVTYIKGLAPQAVWVNPTY